MSGRPELPQGARLLAFAAPYGVLLIALAGSLAYWPGLVTWDSLRQYDQALSGEFDDWHPPIMEWLWGQFLPLAHSPAPMLLLQIGLYACGFAMLIRVVSGKRRVEAAVVVACCAVQPIVIALMATIIKDSLMTGALLCAVGLVALAERDFVSRRMDGLARGLALLLCLFAAALRFNGFLAILPVALWALPLRWRSNWRRGLLSLLVLTPLLVAAMPVANRLIGAQESDVQLSLVIFDLGGMTEHSGVNLFPPLGIADPVAVNHRCYTPVKWDSYSWWVDELCPINFERVRRYFRDHHESAVRLWLTAIVHHPLAYLEHRASHWSINARLLGDGGERPVQVQAPPNEWRFAVTPNTGVGIVDAAALASARTPLGWPWFWMAAMAVLLWSRRRRPVDMVAVLAASALLYGLGYAVFSVASELRYYLWTMCAGSIAIALALGERFSAPSPRSRDPVPASLPGTVPHPPM